MFREAAITVLACLWLTGSTYGQFNDSTSYHLSSALSGNINKASGTTNYLLNQSLKFRIQKNRLVWNTSNVWLYGMNAGKLVNNDFTSNTDFNIYPKKDAPLNYWGLVNYTSSYSLKIISQFQGGAGMAYRIVGQKNVLLRISDGLLYERSKVILSDSATEAYSTVRNSLRLQLRLKLSDWLSTESTGFWQPSLLDGTDFIINANSTLNLKIKKWLSLTASVNYMKISRTQRENLLFIYGAVVDYYF